MEMMINHTLTIDEAIDELKHSYWKCISGDEQVCEKHNEAIDMAIKGLKNMKILCSYDRDSEEYDCD